LVSKQYYLAADIGEQYIKIRETWCKTRIADTTLLDLSYFKRTFESIF